jgi:hypothetical protein
MLAACTLSPGSLASFWSEGFRTFPQVSALAAHLARGLCKVYANAGGQQPIQRQLPLIQYKQVANTLLSMNNYTPLVKSGYDETMQLTFLSQHKLALTARNTVFAL